MGDPLGLIVGEAAGNDEHVGVGLAGAEPFQGEANEVVAIAGDEDTRGQPVPGDVANGSSRRTRSGAQLSSRSSRSSISCG